MVEGVGYPVNRMVANALEKSLRGARTRYDRKNIRSLVMYSGGLDSVALLGNILAETDHHVHVHHIDIVNRDGRSEVESIAVKKTLDYMRQEYRDFEYSSSRNEFNIGSGGGTDLQLTLFTAGRLTTALEGMVDMVFTGHIQPPFWELSEGAAVLNAIFIQRKQKPEWLWPFSKIEGPFGMRKVHIWESIPPELAELTWSCRRPVVSEDEMQVCNNCHACTSRANLKKQLESRTPSWHE